MITSRNRTHAGGDGHAGRVSGSDETTSASAARCAVAARGTVLGAARGRVTSSSAASGQGAAGSVG